jgi:type II secretory pathway pseudopilin PulG
MRYPATHRQHRRYVVKCAAIIAVVLLSVSVCGAQNTPPGQPPLNAPWLQELNKYPGLLDEFARLFDKLQHDVQFPAPRSNSRLLPLLPESTMSYAAFSNYGDVTHQAVEIFRQELRESAVLRDWWEHGDFSHDRTQVLDSLEKVYQLHQYLGEEIVVSGTLEGQDPKLLLVAEIRKPGLKKFFQQLVEQPAGKSKPGVLILDLQELATIKDNSSTQDLVVLVRPDFVIAALDMATLRNFNARLDARSRDFATTPFGQRVLQEYQGGVTTLGAADLQKILSKVPTGTSQNDSTLKRTGFGDVKYVVWEHKSISGQAVSQSELSFIGPRHGAASWLAAPGPLGSLDFVSSKAMIVGTARLKNPAQIFDDVREIASASNSNPFAALEQAEQGFKISLKNDLLSRLSGEITLELDNISSTQPVWKAILGVEDAKVLQQTLNTLMAATQLVTEHADDGGITYYTVQIPNPKTPIEIGYAFVDGYLVLGSGKEVVAEAVRLHRSGGSLGKSKKFLASLPPGHSVDASAVLYQDPIAMTALKLRQLAPEIAESLVHSEETTPAVLWVYGAETAIREASTNSAFDAGAVLIVAAIAIPNLVRSRVAANEASAVASVRTVNTAQVVYETTYPQRGYAPNLATLGQDPRGPNAVSPDHASLLNESLANDSCTADVWCTKSGFLFRVKAVCNQHLCQEYIVVATPVSDNTGGRSFCSTSDGVIRSKAGPPLTSPLSVSQCKAWPALQ